MDLTPPPKHLAFFFSLSLFFFFLLFGGVVSNTALNQPAQVTTKQVFLQSIARNKSGIFSCLGLFKLSQLFAENKKHLNEQITCVGWVPDCPLIDGFDMSRWLFWILKQKKEYTLMMQFILRMKKKTLVKADC